VQALDNFGLTTYEDVTDVCKRLERFERSAALAAKEPTPMSADKIDMARLAREASRLALANSSTPWAYERHFARLVMKECIDFPVELLPYKGLRWTALLVGRVALTNAIKERMP